MQFVDLLRNFVKQAQCYTPKEVEDHLNLTIRSWWTFPTLCCGVHQNHCASWRIKRSEKTESLLIKTNKGRSWTSLPIPYHFQYLITSNTLSLSIPYHFQYLITSNTLSLPIPYHFQYIITSNTFSLPIHYHFQYLITSNTYHFQYLITSNTLSLPIPYHFQYLITSNTLSLPIPFISA
jgi:hypothetical protein